MISRDELQRLLGARQEQTQTLEKKLNSYEEDASKARQWAQLERHQQELGEWLFDQATNENGDIVQAIIDAELGGELFVPGSFVAFFQGCRYQFDLVSTKYSVRELDAAR